MSQQNIREYDLVKNGVTLLSFQSIIDIDGVFEAKVTSQPVEKGEFTSINKVRSPEKYTVQMAFQGAESEINQALDVLKTELKEASLLQVVSPLGISPEASLVKLNYQQSVENGRYGLKVNLSFEEIKQVEAQYSNTAVAPIKSGQAKNPADVSQTESGKQQPKEPRQSVLSKMF